MGNSIRNLGLALGLAGALYASDGKNNEAMAGVVNDTSVGVEGTLNNSSVSGTTEQGNIYAKGGLQSNKEGVSAIGSIATSVTNDLNIGALVNLGPDLSKAVLAISTAIADGSLKLGYRSLSETKDYSTIVGTKKENDRQDTVMLEYKGMLIKSLATYAIAKGYYSQVDSKTLESNIITMSDADFIYTYNQLIKLVGGQEVGFEFGLGKYIGKGTDKIEITILGSNTKYDDSTLDNQSGIAGKARYDMTLNDTTKAKLTASVGDNNMGSSVGVGIEKTLKSIIESIGFEAKSLSENIKVFADLIYNFGGNTDDSLTGAVQIGGSFGNVKVVPDEKLDPYGYIKDPVEKAKFVKLYEEINGVPYDVAVLKNRLSDLHIKLFKRDFNSKEELISFMEELANIKPINMQVVEKTTLVSKVEIPKPVVDEDDEDDEDDDKKVDAVDDYNKTNKNTPINGIRPMDNDKNGEGLTGDISNEKNGKCTVNGNAVNFEPNKDFVGTASCDYKLKGKNGGYDVATIYVQVEGGDVPPNPETQVPPTMGNLPDKTYTVGQSFTYDMKPSITRTNNDDYTCTLETGTLPSGLTFNSSACTITGTLSTAGAHTFSASATDNDGKSAIEGFTITGEAAADITAPSKTGESFNFQLKGFPFSGTISFDEAVDKVTSISINGNGSVSVSGGLGTSTISISGTAPGNIDNAQITITVEDAAGNSRTDTSNSYVVM